MWSSDDILTELRKHRQICAKISIIQATIQQYAEQQTNEAVLPTLELLLQKYEQKELRNTGWLDLLTTEERFVVQTHLIDGLDWARTIVEYENKWGVPNGRSERTLKRIQSKAIQRIMGCLNQLEQSYFSVERGGKNGL